MKEDNVAAGLQVQGNLDQALQTLDRSIQLKSDDANTYFNRGLVLMELGRPQAAMKSYEKAIQLQPNFAQAYYHLGKALQQLEQMTLAAASFTMAIRLKPDYAEAYTDRGNAETEIGQLKHAVKSYGQAIRLKPDNAEVYLCRATALLKLGQLQESVSSCDQAIHLKPGYAEAYLYRARVLLALGQLQESVSICDQAIQLKPDYVEAYSARGDAHRGLGQLQAAIQSYEQAIHLKPGLAVAHYSLSTLKDYQPDDVQIGLMEAMHTHAETSESDQVRFSFALAKAYEDLADYDKSFQYLKAGNSGRKKQLNYHIDDDRKMISSIRRIFTSASLPSALATDGNPSIQPIFIVGMLRSGTSLVEQILASHSQVHGAGELSTLFRLVRPLLVKRDDKEAVQHLSRSEIEKVRVGYLSALQELKVPEKIITDKMPLNFRLIGFILCAFPKAKIIHLKRDPTATCWSNYKHYFPAEANGFAYDLEDLAEFHKLYTDLMMFWRERFPNTIYDLCYEDLTENQQAETRKLLAFCDLDWQPQCLDFHSTKRPVTTMSATQVRKKMYQGSSEAWRKYAAHLQPLTQRLGY
ncbi:MAG: tetratricopeptide repeat protein [Pseudomonadales bacterium]